MVVTCLAKARLVDRPGPLMVAITDEGRRVLETHDGEIDRAFLIRTCPPFANWIADMGELPAAERGAVAGQTVWMVRAGRQGVYAPAFVERSLVIVGWGSLGDVSALTRDELVERVTAGYPGYQRNQRGQAVNTLYRLVHTMTDGDLVITPEPATRTICLGRVSGPYVFFGGAGR